MYAGYQIKTGYLCSKVSSPPNTYIRDFLKTRSYTWGNRTPFPQLNLNFVTSHCANITSDCRNNSPHERLSDCSVPAYWEGALNPTDTPSLQTPPRIHFAISWNIFLVPQDTQNKLIWVEKKNAETHRGLLMILCHTRLEGCKSKPATGQDSKKGK